MLIAELRLALIKARVGQNTLLGVVYVDSEDVDGGFHYQLDLVPQVPRLNSL